MASIRKPSAPVKSSNRPAAQKATKKAIKGAVALSKSRELATNPSSEKDMDKAFALRDSARKAAKGVAIVGSSKSVNKLNDVMKKRIAQSKKSRGK
jgi:hypothetical protein